MQHTVSSILYSTNFEHLQYKFGMVDVDLLQHFVMAIDFGVIYSDQSRKVIENSDSLLNVSILIKDSIEKVHCFQNYL